MVAMTAAENELAEQIKKKEDTKIFKSDNTNPSKNTSELPKLSTTNTGVDSQQVRTKPVSTHDASSAVASSVEPVATTARILLNDMKLSIGTVLAMALFDSFSV